MIHHVQLTFPPAARDAVRQFYTDVVGLAEIPQPDMVTGRGGFWVSGDGIELHLGVEDDFRPQRKGHPALMVADLDGIAERLDAFGREVEWAPEGEVPGLRRFHTFDPVGNRLEFLSAA